MEIWNKINGFEDIYEVSNFGKVRSIDRLINNNGKEVLKKGIILKNRNHTSGYFQVILCKNNKKKYKYVHRLVSESFNSDHDFNLVVNHKNGNKKDNFYKNLECCSQKSNIEHSVSTGLFKSKGSNSYMSKFNDLEVKTIRKMKLDGFNLDYISSKYNVSKATISRIVNNKVYVI